MSPGEIVAFALAAAAMSFILLMHILPWIVEMLP